MRLELAHEAAAIDQRRSDPLRKGLGLLRVFDRVMMQRDDPARARILRQRHQHGPHILLRDEAERVGEGEMRLGIRVQQHDSEPIRLRRRQNHREDFLPDRRQPHGQAQAARIGEARDHLAMRFKPLRERPADFAGVLVDDMDAPALHRLHR